MADLIEKLLSNRENWSRISVALANSTPYKIKLDFLDFYLMFAEKTKGMWN